jgi:helix-turn-helix protein
MRLASDYLTPPQIARRFGVEPAKVLSWIRCGDLSAINMAERLNGRPRWRVSQSSLDSFLVARTSRPAQKTMPRRRKRPEVTEFF